MPQKPDLSTVPAEDLLAELHQRPGYVISSWNTEDVAPTLENYIETLSDFENEQVPDLTDEQIKEAAVLFLQKHGTRLQDILAERGNDWIAERCFDSANAILEQVKQEASEAPSP